MKALVDEDECCCCEPLAGVITISDDSIDVGWEYASDYSCEYELAMRSLVSGGRSTIVCELVWVTSSLKLGVMA